MRRQSGSWYLNNDTCLQFVTILRVFVAQLPLTGPKGSQASSGHWWEFHQSQMSLNDTHVSAERSLGAEMAKKKKVPSQATVCVWKVNIHTWLNWTFPLQITVKKGRKQGGCPPFSHNNTDNSHEGATRQWISRWKCSVNIWDRVFDMSPIRVKGTTTPLQQILSTQWKGGRRCLVVFFSRSRLFWSPCHELERGHSFFSKAVFCKT